MAGEVKKVLIIVYYWPPSGGSGVQRWMYFARYLGDFGITPVVLTVDPKKASYKDWDESNSEMVKDVKTFTTNTLELIKLYSLATSGSTTKGIPQGHVGAKKHGLFGKLSSFVRGNLFVPDARVGWKAYAYRKAVRIIEEENINFVVTSGPPHSTHLIGKKLKEKLDITWMADLRDPWSELYYNKELPRMGWAKNLDTRLEKQVLEKADAVLTVGPSLRNLLAEKVPDQKSKFHYILNGYDDEALKKVEEIGDGKFRITFIGQFAQAQPHEELFRAINEFCHQYQADTGKIMLCLAGTIDENILKLFGKLPGISVEHYGRVPHLEALKLMKSSQVLLNSLAELEASKILISGKLMEYISTGNPVLCIGDPDGDAAHLLQTLPNAKMFNRDDISGMRAFLCTIFEDWKSGKPLAHGSTEHQQNSRYETTRQLARLIKSIERHV
jgi:glycosyltransferase involved in cell wall biosynthesis